MTVCFSGAYTDSKLAHDVYEFFESRCYPSIYHYVVEIYHCDLSEDNVKGYQEKNGDEFLLHIDANLDEDEYIMTIFHELVHCVQDIRGLSNNEEREDEAYKLEEQFFDEFMLTETSKVSL